MKKYAIALLFSSLAGSVQAQPWIEKVADLCKVNSSSFINEMAVCNDRLYFTAMMDQGYEAYVSDGTEAGTYLLKKPASIYVQSIPHGYTSCNGKVLFAANVGTVRYLMKSDGTVAGTDIAYNVPFKDIGELAALNNSVIFSGTENQYGAELWITDGTETGTHLLKDISTGSVGSNPSGFYVLGNELYFTANDGVHGNELWATDGTNTGTHLVADIYTGSGHSSPGNFTEMNNLLYFSCASDTNGLWVTDGTAAGTQLVAPGLNARNMMSSGGKLYFCSAGSGSFELYTSDGTAAGTHLVKDINPATHSLFIPTPVAHNGKIFFVQADGTDSTREFLWMTDGTAMGTVKVQGSFVDPTGLISYCNKLYFAGTYQPAPGLEASSVFAYDGVTVTMASPVAPPAKPGLSAVPGGFVEYRHSLYFSANFDSTTQELWRLTDLPLNIAQQETDKNKIYPNPATAVVHIELQEEGKAVLTIYSVLGQQVLQQQLDKKETAIDIRSLIPGVYTVHVQQGGAQHTERLVVR